MASNLLFYQLLLIALVLLCLLVHVALADSPLREPKTPLAPKPRRHRRSKEPESFVGLIHQPLCEACEQGDDTRPKTPGPGSPPPVLTFTRGRRRTITIFVPTRIVHTTAGSDWVTCAPTAIPVASPGASCSVSRAKAISMKRLARSSTANTHLLSSSCTSSPVELRG